MVATSLGYFPIEFWEHLCQHPLKNGNALSFGLDRIYSDI